MKGNNEAYQIRSFTTETGIIIKSHIVFDFIKSKFPKKIQESSKNYLQI